MQGIPGADMQEAAATAVWQAWASGAQERHRAALQRKLWSQLRVLLASRQGRAGHAPARAQQQARPYFS